MKKKMNNKGFSLVELIVVVLIMAIIGVALAPQVIKWVNNARISADVTTYDSLVDAAQLALANETVYNDCSTVADLTIKLTKTGVTFTNAPTSFVDKFKEVLTAWESAKAKQDNTYVITVKNGSVFKTTPPSDTLAE